MIRLTLLLFLAFFYGGNVHGQRMLDPSLLNEQRTLGPLKIGDQVPSVELTNLRNYSAKSLKLSDFKGKLIILDFWNRYCANCIQAFPEMQKLQEKFKDRIQIILVTNDTEEKLQRLFNVSPNIKSNKLPMVIGDSVLHALFPHNAVPFHVWIDERGTLLNTTAGWNSNETSIQLYLNGKPTNVSSLTPVLSKEQLKLPILDQFSIVGGGLSNKLISYSFVSKRNPMEARSGWSYCLKDSSGHCDYRMSRIINLPIIDHFRYCWLSKKGGIHIKSIIELKNSENLEKYYPPDSNDKKGLWYDDNVYCYEIKVNQKVATYDSSQVQQKIQYMLADLERYFNIKSRLEVRNLTCYILYRMTDKELFKGSGKDTIVEKTDNGEYVLRNVNMSVLAEKIEIYFGDYNGPNEIPVFDETCYTGLIDLKINVSPGQSLPQLRKRLAGYGLGIREETRKVECLVLTEL